MSIYKNFGKLSTIQFLVHIQVHYLMVEVYRGYLLNMWQKLHWVISCTILRLFCPFMLFEKPLCFKDIRGAPISTITFNY